MNMTAHCFIYHKRKDDDIYVMIRMVSKEKQKLETDPELEEKFPYGKGFRIFL